MNNYHQKYTLELSKNQDFSMKQFSLEHVHSIFVNLPKVLWSCFPCLTRVKQGLIRHKIMLFA